MAVREYATLSGADLGVLAGYFVVIILIGAFDDVSAHWQAIRATPHQSDPEQEGDSQSMLQSPRKIPMDLRGPEAMWRSNRQTATGYFLAGRSMWFLPIGASLFVSNIGTEHFIGLAGSGAANGISVGAWEVNAVFLLQLLGWVFIPVYIACGTCTMPEYLSKRFGGRRLRVYFAFVSLMIYIFIKCSGDLFTGALFIQQSLSWDLYVSIVILVLLTAVLTITGGLTAVMYTDTLQAVLMICGATYLTIIGFQEVGGFQGLLEKYPQAVPTNVSAIVVNSTCHWPDRNAFRMLRDVDDDYTPWLGFMTGQTLSSLWYWCADQVIVQRALAAKSVSHAQGGTLLAGFLKILPLFIMVMPGMISRVLYPDDVACTNPDYCMEVCQSRAGCSNIAYPRLVLGLMPDGARGLMMAVVIAALMSDLDSIFNSASTLFTMDIWRNFRKRATSTELMVASRLFILVIVGLSIAWVPMIKEANRGQIFMYLTEVTNYLTPPFAAIYLLGVLVPMVNEKGAFWSLMLALVIGVSRLVITFVYKGEGYCGEENEVPSILANFHYMYFSLFNSSLTAIVAIIISCFTGRPKLINLYKTTYWTRHDSDPPEQDLKANRQSPIDNTSDGSVADAETLIDITNVTEAGENENHSDTAGAYKTELVDPGVGVVKESADTTARWGTLKRLFFKFVCGFHDGTKDKEQGSAVKQHLEELANLEQNTTEKVILCIGLFAILSAGVAMYIFWSVYDFHEAPYYPNNASFLLPGDEPAVNQTSVS